MDARDPHALESDDLARLEQIVLERFDTGEEPVVEELIRAFPTLTRETIEGVVRSVRLVAEWLGELGQSARPASGEPDWLLPDEKIGGYIVLRRIAGGGMGQVYQAVQESLYPRQVALKVHRVGEEPGPALARARKEAEVASRLAHPHLAAVYDMGHDRARGLAYFSMQFVDGPDLGAVFARRREPRDRRMVRRIVTRISEVAGALTELHGRGYVHRDVKPENILLRSNGGRDGKSEAAVLVDFGLVRAESALRERARSAGTPGYMPPEAHGGGDVTPAWDVYSLGVVLWLALTARALRRGEDGDLEPPSEGDLAALRADAAAIDADLAAVVSRATAKDPRARYADAGELQQDLEAWLDRRPVAARRARWSERLWRAARRRPKRAAAILSAAAMVALATLVVAGDLAVALVGHRALDRGELLSGLGRLESVRLAPLRWVRPARAELLRDLRRDRGEHPLRRVGELMRAGREHEGFTLAAAYLARDGVDGAHPEIERWWLALLDGPSSDARAHALRAAARLFYEHPAESPEALARAKPYRAAALGVLADPRATLDEALHAACVLGGTGILSDLDPLMDWCEIAPPLPEVYRLACTTSDRVVRRARLVQPIEALRRFDHGAIERRWARIWPFWSTTRLLDMQPGSATAATGLVRSWALLHRVTGHAITTPREEWSAGWEELFEAAVRADSMRLRSQLERATAREDRPTDWRAQRNAYFIGVGCAFADDVALRDEYVARLPAELTPFVLEGWSHGRQEVESGPDPTQRPDPRSLLSAVLAGEFDAPSALFPMRLGGLGDDELASWDFFRVQARAGVAGDPRLHGGAYWLDDEPGHCHAHVRLPRPGSSLELPFEVPSTTPLNARWILEIGNLAAQRSYLPFEGAVAIRIELDGHLIADRIAVQETGNSLVSTVIDGALLSPGPHTIRITLVDGTTTYWLHQVRLRRVQNDDWPN